MQTNPLWFKKVAKNWDRYASPVRPSKSEVAKMGSHMKAGGRTLILGATPELRDLAHKMRQKVTVADMNIEMLLGMGDLMKYKNRIDSEIWIKGSWLELPLKPESFDYILGDFVITNIPPELKNVFFARLNRILKKDGLFITRHNEMVRRLGVAEVMDYYVKQKNPNISGLDLAMQWVSYDAKKEGFCLKDIRRDMLAFIAKQPKAGRAKYAKLYKKFNEYFPFEKFWHLRSPENECATIKKYFNIRVVERGDDHRLVEFCPIFVLEKKI